MSDLLDRLRAELKQYIRNADNDPAEEDYIYADTVFDVLAAVERLQPAQMPPTEDLKLLVRYVVDNGALHDEDCPGDDTCECSYQPVNAAVNRLCHLADPPAQTPDRPSDDRLSEICGQTSDKEVFQPWIGTKPIVTPHSELEAWFLEQIEWFSVGDSTRNIEVAGCLQAGLKRLRAQEGKA